MARERLLLIRTSPRLFILGWPIKGRILFRIVATLSPAGKRREAHSLSVLAERSSGLANGYDSAFKREGERVESHSFSFPRGTISVRPYRCFPDTGRTMEKEGEGEREREREPRLTSSDTPYNATLAPGNVKRNRCNVQLGRT